MGFEWGIPTGCEFCAPAVVVVVVVVRMPKHEELKGDFRKNRRGLEKRDWRKFWVMRRREKRGLEMGG